MKYITIIDGMDIKRVVRCKDALRDAQLEGNEFWVEGRYPPNEYDFNGEDFTLLSPPEENIFSKPIRVIVFELIKQLAKAGFYLPLHKYFVRSKQDAKNLIDQKASEICDKFVSAGKYTPFEYLYVQQTVQQWIASGSDENNVPLMLQTEIDVRGHSTAAEAAAYIMQQAAIFDTAIATTRDIRQKGAKAVFEASQADFKTVMQTYLDQLENLPS